MTGLDLTANFSVIGFAALQPVTVEKDGMAVIAQSVAEPVRNRALLRRIGNKYAHSFVYIRTRSTAIVDGRKLPGYCLNPIIHVAETRRGYLHPLVSVKPMPKYSFKGIE
jgi:hypothetical protein